MTSVLTGVEMDAKDAALTACDDNRVDASMCITHSVSLFNAQ